MGEPLSVQQNLVVRNGHQDCTRTHHGAMCEWMLEELALVKIHETNPRRTRLAFFLTTKACRCCLGTRRLNPPALAPGVAEPALAIA